MRDCRLKNKFVVNRLSKDDFLSVKELEKCITNRKKDVDKSKVNWLNTHEIFIEKREPTILKMRRHIGDVFQIVNIEKFGRGPKPQFKSVKLTTLWPEGRPLSNKKVENLAKLLQLVDDEDKSFWQFIGNIQASEFEDDIDGFGATIDFDPEEECID